MNKPLTFKEAKNTFGENFMDTTCSEVCRRCRTSNYFHGLLWNETMPEVFECVNCGDTVHTDRLPPENRK